MTRPKILRDCQGASAAEFALVLPLLIVLLLGMIDSGRFMWEYNQAEKATQMGVRYAVVTDTVLGAGFRDYSFALSDNILAGDPVPAAQFSVASCTSSGCNCTGGAVCSAISHDSEAFNRIVERMKIFYPQLQPENVRVEYRNVGLGFAGDPNGPDVAALVTVSLTGTSFQPLSTMMLGKNVTMPDFRAALTLEDGVGSDRAN